MSLLKHLRKALIEENTLHKGEDPEAYRKLASTGFILAHPVKIKGQDKRADNGINYHSTVKFFDKENDDHDEAHKTASGLDLTPPDPKETHIKTDVLKDRNGNDVYAVKLHGKHADRLKENHKKFSHLGHPENYDWNAHISVPKAVHDEIKAKGHKTAHEAGIEFGPAQLKRGPKVIHTYHPKGEIEKAEPLLKPWSSQAQAAWGHSPEGKEALGGEAAVKEWDRATRGKHLPKHVKKSEELEKGALKNLLTAGAMGAALSSAVPSEAKAPVHQSLAPQVSTQGHNGYNRDKVLNAISQVESSGGKNTAHKPTSMGTAYGKFAIMPDTIHDTIRLNPDLKRQHQKALNLQGDDLHRYMQDNPKLEQEIATRHLQRLEHHFGHNPEALGYAWNHGILGTNRALNQKQKIGEHPYVQKFKHAYESKE